MGVSTLGIDVADLRKTFLVPVREAGLRVAVRGLARRTALRRYSGASA